MSILSTRFFFPASASALAVFLFFAESASADRPVHLRPSESAPVIARLTEGETPNYTEARPPLTDEQREAGWRAVSIVRNFSGYAHRSDVTKDLVLRPGSEIFQHQRRDERHLLTESTRDDLIEVTGISGDWASVSFRKPLTGFLREEVRATPPRIIEEEPLFIEPEEIRDAPPPPPPPAETRGRPSPPPVTSGSAIPEDGSLRIFEGRLARVRSFLGQSPPYPHQLLDHSGRRIAYLDLNRLLITVPLEKEFGTNLLVYGKAEPIPNRRDFVIRVEHMRTN